MSQETAMVSMAGDGIVVTVVQEHPEPIPAPDQVAPPWNACTIPGCKHSPACPAKLRAWGGYGQRYICKVTDCAHSDCPPRQRADEDHQPLGDPYQGPALPQHVVDMDDRPLGPPMRAVKDAAGDWHLVPVRGAQYE